MPAKQVPLPTDDELSGTAAASDQTPGTIVVPAEDGSAITLREPVKTVGHGVDAVELRRLTPAERARKRLIFRLVTVGICLGILVITLLLLAK